MSGIKENKEIRQVRRVNIEPAKSISIIDNESMSIPSIVEATAKSTTTLVAPHLIKTIFKEVEKAGTTETLKEVQKMATQVSRKAVASIAFSGMQTAQHVVALVEQIKVAGTVAEVKEACHLIQSICIQEQMPAFKKGITETVKAVMTEVGFSNISVKTIGITPIVVAKNAKGQTIRTEVTEDKDQRIDLVRIQSAIPESECDSLNEKINLAFKKHGLDYSRFSKTSSANNARRTFNFSDNEVIAKNNQTNHLKQ